VQELSFDAWGQRRNATDWQAVLKDAQNQPLALSAFSAINRITNRGYTGHEMVDGVDIIHMNGRIYDAKLARFLQADPFIQAPYNTQSLNRYSYVWNNPLNATDPSGYIAWTLVFEAFKLALASFVIADVIATVGINSGWSQDLISALTIAATVWLTGGITPETLTTTHIVTLAVMGGITSMLQGGKFGHGFASAGLGASIGQAMGGFAKGAGNGLKNLRKFIAKTVVGGTISEATGGKFANGAAGAAFAWVVSASSSIDRDQSLNDNEKSKILDDTKNHGPGRELYDGQVVVKKYGSADAVVSDSELATVRSDLEMIFNDGGSNGSRLQQSIMAGEPTTIILNDSEANIGRLNARLLAIDLNTDLEFLNAATNNFQRFSTTRILAHELSHSNLGLLDEGVPFTMDFFGKEKTITPYPSVRFTDGVMRGINGSVRKSYNNAFK
jgi:RHS repeat-associated protein